MLRDLRVFEFCDYYGPASMGGSERVAREVNQRLVELGAQLTVASAVRGAPYRDEGIRVLPRPAHDLSAVLGAQLSVSRGYLRWALRAIRATAPHVLYTHSLHFHGSLVAACASRRLRLPLVTVVHVAGVEMLSGRSRVLAEAHERTAGRFILASSSEVVAVSPPVVDHCRDQAGPRARVSLAMNGVDHACFRPTPSPGGALTVMYVGRLIANKGPALLIDAVRDLGERGVATQLVVVGDGPQRGQLEHAAEGARVPVTFVGHTADVPGWLERAHVVVRPSFTEGLPLTVLEAMASRRCVVVSDIPPHREIVEHLGNGLLHRSGDAADLADKLALALRDHALRERLADAGQRSSRAFTWEATTVGHARALARACGRSGLHLVREPSTGSAP